MLLYESHSVIHGRPFPLKGRYFANIFIHFEPTGRKLQQDLNKDYAGLPPHIKNRLPEARRPKREHPPAVASTPLPKYRMSRR